MPNIFWKFIYLSLVKTLVDISGHPCRGFEPQMSAIIQSKSKLISQTLTNGMFMVRSESSQVSCQVVIFTGNHVQF